MAQTAPVATDLPKLDADQPVQTISGGHLVAKALKNEGIKVIFTLCGGHIIDIYDGCEDEGIKIIDVRHEQVAAHAADGYARVTGGSGCAVVTAGPGTTKRARVDGVRQVRAINVWIDPNEFAPGTMNQTMYK
jgi:acetolactate synthase-1/2/3 large subunit